MLRVAGGEDAIVFGPGRDWVDGRYGGAGVFVGGTTSLSGDSSVLFGGRVAGLVVDVIGRT